jgi:hypothetical protein
MFRSGERKVKVALYGRDLRCSIKSFPLNSDGTRIEIKSGGDYHFMPEIEKENPIKLPYRSIFSPWKISYFELYFAQKWAKKCVDFLTPMAYGPDPKQVMDAAANKILESKGKQKTEVPIIMYLIVLILLAIAVKIFGVM